MSRGSQEGERDVWLKMVGEMIMEARGNGESNGVKNDCKRWLWTSIGRGLARHSGEASRVPVTWVQY